MSNLNTPWGSLSWLPQGGTERPAEPSPAHAHPDHRGVEPDSGLETRGHSRPRGAAKTPRAAPPLCGSGQAGGRRLSPAPLTHLRVQRHQLHERPGLLKLGERHRAAAEPPALLPAAPGCAASGPRGPCRCPETPARPRAPRALAGPSAAAAAAALALRLPPSPGAAAPIGYLRGGGAWVAPPSPHGAAFPARTPAPDALGVGPASKGAPGPRSALPAADSAGFFFPGCASRCRPRPGHRCPVLAAFGILTQMCLLPPGGGTATLHGMSWA